MMAERLATTPVATYRADYQAPRFTITTVDLTFDLQPEQTRVVNQMRIERVGQHQEPLRLQGEGLQLISLACDGVALEDYEVNDTELVLADCPEVFTLTVETQINPAANKALEGLYMAGDTYCTQCEAEGFRRITYFLDRPDVLAVYTTRIIADKTRYPHRLSNGNLVREGLDAEGRDCIEWHDPHPKPCYLFALVAGQFDVLRDHFTTQEGREVKLELYVDPGMLNQADHAMQSLKRAMAWDESRFGLSYDLDIYMIVAVDFFNMGAMENKGLNIFNSKYVLANPATATDQDYANVEAVIGHEYFHNWTGNRITCRDWFQLSLKEGLTVFRDQEFSADMGARAVHRIQAVQVIRTHQFSEDAGPMAHPIRPDKVVEMNNFYTVTVYDKGAEVIRMLHTLLGEQLFQAGMQEYVKRHDGQAVTCEDFIRAMEAASDRDLSLFRRWYSQAGTPELTASHSYSAATQQLSITLSQHTPATPGQRDKQALHIPVVVSAYSATGKPLSLASDGAVYQQTPAGGTILELTQATQTFVFDHLDEAPVLSVLDNFSAPVKLKFDQPAAEQALLAAHANDAFIRWDAMQGMLRHAVLQTMQQQQLGLSDELTAALDTCLQNITDPALAALMLAPPTVEELVEHFAQIPLAELLTATEQVHDQLATTFLANWRQGYQQASTALASADAQTAVGWRSFRNRCLEMLARASRQQPDPELLHLITTQFERAAGMTDSIGALLAATKFQLPNASTLLSQFEQQWSAHTLVMDKWLQCQASAQYGDVVARVEALQAHPHFSWDNPNRIYALLMSFGRNMKYFHQADGAGYALIEQALTQLNSTNPQVASRLITPLLQWRRFDADRAQQMQAVLARLQALPNLAKDLFEKIQQSLSGDPV